jgi:hypothetical protein
MTVSNFGPLFWLQVRDAASPSKATITCELDWGTLVAPNRRSIAIAFHVNSVLGGAK